MCEDSKKIKQRMKQMPHKTIQAQRTINEMFPKKKNANTSLYILTFCMMSAFLYYFLFNHLYDVSCSFKRIHA